MLKFLFLFLMASGMPVAIAMAGSLADLHPVSGKTCRLRGHPPHDRRHRQLPAAGGALLHPGRQPDEQRRHHQPHLQLALALVGWLKGGLGHVNVVGSVIFSGMSGTAIADAAGLGTIEIKAMKDHGYSSEFAVGVTAASATLGPDHPAQPALRDLRDDGQRVGRRAVPGRHPAGPADGGADDDHGGYFAHKNGWGGDIKFSGSALRQGLIELAVVPLAGGGLGCWSRPGRRRVRSSSAGLVLLFVADWLFRSRPCCRS
jgi:hypothetical protein